MMISLTLKQIKSIIEDGYRVDIEVTDSTGMPEEVFVYERIKEEYSHVAKMFDMVVFPVIPEVDKAFYRGNQVVQDFENLHTANQFSDFVISRLEALILEYEKGAAEFEGEETIVVTAPEESP